ncbi:MAG: SOS-response transcriptional repressor LexA [Gammaproteobacteria bacterium]|jgi:SOS-response transcriptional repressor LexA
MTACIELEPYALQVKGGNMSPEFPLGCVVVVEPGAVATDGAFVIADIQSGLCIARYRANAQTHWIETLCPLVKLACDDEFKIRGVVVQRAAGRGIRRKHYVPTPSREGNAPPNATAPS